MEILEKLEEKINKAVALIEKLTEENESLADENKRLKMQLSEAGSKLASAEKLDDMKAEKVKDRLDNILQKLNSLEQI